MTYDIESACREIHATPCAKCPSAHYPSDPESEDMREWYQARKIPVWDAIFRCAWRPEKLCRGVCDYMGVTESDLQGPVEHVL